MQTCKSIANSSASNIISCSYCLDTCDVLFNHSVFCILECAKKVTTSATTILATTTAATTTVAPRTGFSFLTTETPNIWYNQTYMSTTMITTTIFNHVLPKNKTLMKNISNNSEALNHVYIKMSKDSSLEKTPEETFGLILIGVPIAFILCCIIIQAFKVCYSKTKLTRTQSRTIIPLNVDDVVVNIDNEQETEHESKTTDNIIKTG